MILPPVAHDVKVISIGMFVANNQPVVWRGPMLHRALQQFLADVYWGDLDVLLMDLPPGTGDIAISVAQLVPPAELLVVTTPQQAAAEVAERAGTIALQTHQQIAGVIENMSWLPCPHCDERIDVFGSGGGQAGRRRAEPGDRRPGAPARPDPARHPAARGRRHRPAAGARRPRRARPRRALAHGRDSHSGPAGPRPGRPRSLGPQPQARAEPRGAPRQVVVGVVRRGRPPCGTAPSGAAPAGPPADVALSAGVGRRRSSSVQVVRARRSSSGSSRCLRTSARGLGRPGPRSVQLRAELLGDLGARLVGHLAQLPQEPAGVRGVPRQLLRAEHDQRDDGEPDALRPHRCRTRRDPLPVGAGQGDADVWRSVPASCRR